MTPNFDFTLNFTEIMNLCQTYQIGIPGRILQPAIACGLISDSSKVGELINELKSKTIGGRTVEAQIFIPYYDTSSFITPNWDGTTFNRIVLDDIFAKKNVGLPTQIWNGNTYVLVHYPAGSDELSKKIHWIVGIDVPLEKNIIICTCTLPSTTGNCTKGGKIGNSACSVTAMGECSGSCGTKMIID